MVKVLMHCPYDGAVMDTGLDLPAGSVPRKYAQRTAQCPRCNRSWPVRMPFLEGEETIELHRYHVALDCTREFAAEIGIFISCFALVEGYLEDLMTRLTGTEKRDAWTILGRHQVGERLQLLRALAVMRHETDEQRTAVERFLPRLTDMTATRNKYAHSQYATTFNDAVIVSSWLYDSKRQKRESNETLDTIVGNVETIKRLICDLHGYIHRQEMPPPSP